MIQLTERAMRSLESILAAHQAPKDQGVKVSLGDEGELAMTIGRPREGDTVVSPGRRPLLILDAAVSGRFDEAVLDFSQADGEEPHFFLRQQREGGAS